MAGCILKQRAGELHERNLPERKDSTILLDESGSVGRMYGAKTTPHMFVIGKDGKLQYAGAIDDSNGRGPGKTNYVREAVSALLAGKDVAVKESKSFGCSVKYGSDGT